MDFHNLVFWRSVIKVVNVLRKGDKESKALSKEVDCCHATFVRCMKNLEESGFVTKKVSSKNRGIFIYSLNDPAFRAFCVERDLYTYVSETIEELGDVRDDFVEFLKNKDNPAD